MAALFRKAGPLIDAIGALLNQLEPHVMAAYRALLVFYKLIEPYHPDELLEALFGLFLAFFGGRLEKDKHWRFCGATRLIYKVWHKHKHKILTPLRSPHPTQPFDTNTTTKH